MSILTRLGLTKEGIAKLLGIEPKQCVEEVIQRPKRKKTFKGRKQWKIADNVVAAVKAEPTHRTLEEIARKHKVSIYWVWCVRKNRIRVAK